VDKDLSLPNGRFSALFAAAIGSVMVFFVNRAEADSLTKLLVYFIPALTLLISSISGELEDLLVVKWRLFKSDFSVKDFIVHCDKMLADNSLNETQREQIVAHRNQLRFNALESAFDNVNKSLSGSNMKQSPLRKPATKATNRKKTAATQDE
jgi:hypothetical protein